MATKKKAKKNWIQGLKKGGLHRALGIPQGEKIPAKDLVIKKTDSPKMKKQKSAAKTLKKLRRK